MSKTHRTSKSAHREGRDSQDAVTIPAGTFSPFPQATLTISKNQAGFTLIEIMLAMTLLSVMMVLLFGTLRISAQSWEAGEGKVAQSGEAALVYQFFRRHLGVTQPLWQDFNPDQERAFSFVGRPDALQFVSPLPASAARPGLQMFSVYLRQMGGDKWLTVAVQPFFPEAEEQTAQDEGVVILKHVNSFQVGYFGMDPVSGTNGWQDEWVDKEALPRLVRIRIVRDNELYWPDMFIALKAAADTAVDPEFSDGIDQGFD